MKFQSCVRYLFVATTTYLYGCLVTKSVDGKKNIMGDNDDPDVWERFLLKKKDSSKDEFKRTYIVITKSEDAVTLLPNGGSFSDFIVDSQPPTGGTPSPPADYSTLDRSWMLEDLVVSNPKFEIQGSSTIQSGKVYDTGSIELVNIPEGVEIPFLPRPDPPIFAQFAGGRQPRFVPEGDPFYIFHGICVATSGITTPSITIDNFVSGTTVVPQPVVTTQSCKLNLCLGGGGFDCIFIYSGTAFVFNLGEGIVINNGAEATGGGCSYPTPCRRHNRALQAGMPTTFKSPPLPPPFPGTIIGGTGSFEGIEGTVNIATVAGTTGLLLNNAPGPGGMKDIHTTAFDNDILTTLVTAITAADLKTTLSGDGPFTVFAPNDDAFAALDKVDKKLMPCLLLPESVETLKTIMTYHVASGEVRSTDLSNGQQIPSLQGEDISVDITGTTVMLNDDAQVIAADVMATNGVIHVIDAVLFPPTVNMEDFLVWCREINPDGDSYLPPGDSYLPPGDSYLPPISGGDNSPFPPVGSIVQVISVVSNMPLPPAP